MGYSHLDADVVCGKVIIVASLNLSSLAPLFTEATPYRVSIDQFRRSYSMEQHSMISHTYFDAVSSL